MLQNYIVKWEMKKSEEQTWIMKWRRKSFNGNYGSCTLPLSIINNPLSTLKGDSSTILILLKCFKFNPMCEQR
jgi:hypothetical protein